MPKKAPGSFRMIHHLSFPPELSINSGIPDVYATVQYTSLDVALQAIYQLGNSCFMSKTDIESAFRIIPISPRDHYLLGIFFDGNFYYDKTLPMWLRSSCNIFERFRRH